MTTKVDIETAQATLRQIIDGLKPGDEVKIVCDDQPVARLTSEVVLRVQWSLVSRETARILLLCS